jgi:hypothetical protein
MLTVASFDQISVPIVELYDQYSATVIADIARRLAKMKMTSTAAWQLQRLSESGMVYQNALRELSRLTGQSEATLKSLFEQAGVRSMTFDDAIYKAAGLNPIPLNLSPAMLNVLKSGLLKTAGEIRNLTMTTALSAQRAFIDAADLAYLQVTTGAFTYDQAIKAAIKEVASNGLTSINYASGKEDHLDVAMRRAVLTGIGQTTAKAQDMRMDEMGTDLVAVSAHAGARNRGTGPMNHESWQGKVYSRSGTNPKYGNFYVITGYGTGEGLGGWNCRHSMYPFFEGISYQYYNNAIRKELASKTVIYNGRKIDQYSASQIQRSYERMIRQWKRQRDALEAAGKDNRDEVLKVREWQAKLRDFVNQTSLPRQSARERV